MGASQWLARRHLYRKAYRVRSLLPAELEFFFRYEDHRNDALFRPNREERLLTQFIHVQHENRRSSHWGRDCRAFFCNATVREVPALASSGVRERGSRWLSSKRPQQRRNSFG